MSRFRWAPAIGGAVCVLALGATAAVAEPLAEFYRGKTIRLVIGSAPGGGYDAYGRAVGDHLADNIPGRPKLVVQNMPGSGSQKMANWIYNIAPRDGTAIGGPQNGVAFEPLFHLLSPNGQTAKFDGTKFNWIGSATQDTVGVFVWADSDIETFSDLQSKPVIFGSSGANTDNSVMAQVLNGVFGTKIKLTVGYKGSSGLMLAVERGEVKGAAGMPYSSMMARWPDWVEKNQIRYLVQLGLERHPRMTGVPFALDLVKKQEDREVLELIFAKFKMARPYFLPPGVPEDRVAGVRKAFADTMKDPAFLATVKKRRLEVDPVPGEEIQELVRKLYATPEQTVAKVRAILGGGRKR